MPATPHQDPSVGRRVLVGAGAGAVLIGTAAAGAVAAFVDVAGTSAAAMGLATGVTGGSFFGALAGFATATSKGATR